MSSPDSAARDRRVQQLIVLEGSVNALVLTVKIVVGLATGSMAILGDAVHSLTDVANNGVAWFVARQAARPPDEGHPYGHRKFETVAVFGLAMLLTVMAFELAMSTLRREAPEIVHSGWALAVMLGVLGVNTALALWQGAWARRLDSEILRADANHTMADVLTTIAVIAGWQAAAAGFVWLDDLAALAVAVLILVFAYGLFRRCLPVLLDSASLEPEVLVDLSLRVPGVIGVRRVRSRWCGSRIAVDLVILAAPDLTTAASHDIATEVEEMIRANFPIESATVHVEPAFGARMPPAEVRGSSSD